MECYQEVFENYWSLVLEALNPRRMYPRPAMNARSEMSVDLAFSCSVKRCRRPGERSHRAVVKIGFIRVLVCMIISL